MERDKNRIDRIRERAYLLWERSDRSREEHYYWLQAEREIDTDGGLPKRRTVAKRTSAAAAPPAPVKAAKTKLPKDKAAKDKAAKPKGPKSKDAAKNGAKPKPKPKPQAKETFPAHR